MTRWKAREIGNSIIQNRYPGFYLIMDRITKDSYISLWGLDTQRVELAFANRTSNNSAFITEYKIQKFS